MLKNLKVWRDERGAALIAVTWLVFIIALLATAVLAVTLAGRRTIAAQEKSLQDLLVAESAVEIFMHRMFYDEEEQIYRSGRLEIYDRVVDVDVVYESGLVNLTRAEQPLLSAVFGSKGIDETSALSLAARIIDWRDRDNDREPGGAEHEDYLGNGLSYGPRNGPFEAVGEVQHVLGLGRDVFLCTRPYFTVYSLSGTVDWEHASEPMIEVLRWAHDRNWQEVVWPDPDDIEPERNVVGSPGALGGHALSLLVSVSAPGVAVDPEPVTFRMVIRYKTTANRTSYSVLSPLSLSTNATNDSCVVN